MNRWNIGDVRATRRSFLARTADGPVLVIGTHFATPTAGRVVSDAGAWRFEIRWRRAENR
jgi:hypothetical protein